MKKTTIICFASLSLGIAIVAGLAFFSSTSQSVDAQTFDPEVERQKDERDKTIPAEKLDRVRAEIAVVQEAILLLMKKDFRKYELTSLSISDPAIQGSGRRGQAGLLFDWKRGKARFDINITFVFDPAEAEKYHLKKLNGIAMGEGSSAPAPFGDDAVIIKNVQFNKTMTWVALHFRKGRLLISTSYANGYRPNTENEKELLKIMKEIYPLLIARENFEDV